MNRAFKRSEDALAEIPDNICQHIQAPAMGHAERDVIDSAGGGAFDQLIEHGNNRFASLQRKSLLAQVFGVQKSLELFRRNQFPKNLLLDFDRYRLGTNKLAPDLFPYPELLSLALNMAIFGADFPAISALKNIQDLAQSCAFGSCQTASDKNSIQVPDRQVVSFHVQLRVVEHRHGMQRIDIGDQVSPHAIGIDQFHHARLFDSLLLRLIGSQEERIAIKVPAQRRMRNSEVCKNVVVKLMLANDQLVNLRQERSGLGALNNAMIVGATDCYRLADAELRQSFRGHRLVLRRILDGAGGDNH